jgi:hypothetical protein
LLLFVGVVVAYGDGRYEGQQVVRIDISDPALKLLLQEVMWDVWDHDGTTMDVRIESPELLESLKAIGVNYEVIIADLDAYLDEFGHTKAKTHREGVDEWFEEFHQYNEIIAWYNQSLASHPGLAHYGGVLGTTVGGRQIHGYILRGTADGSKKLYFQAGLHAREWASPATVAYVYHSLLNGYGTDPDATWILNNYWVAFIPSANPDGYQFTWTNDRMWRKNRRNPPTGSNCYGVDLNRNWDSQGYGEGYGSSSNPCSDVYHGIAAFSEAETAASSRWFNNLGAQTIWGAIDFHAYGRYVLRPYGWPVTATDREAELKDIGDETADEIESVYNTRWTSQRSAQLYPAAGGTEDWMFDSTNSNCLAYCFELRGNSFVLPPEEIVLSGEEVWAGLKVWSAMIFEANSKKLEAIAQ